MRRPTATFPILFLALLLTVVTFLGPVQISLGRCAASSSLLADAHDGCEETIAAVHARLQSAPRTPSVAQPTAAPTPVALPPLAWEVAGAPPPPDLPALMRTGPPPSLRAPPFRS